MRQTGTDSATAEISNKASGVGDIAGIGRNGHSVAPNDPLGGKSQKQIFEDCVWLSAESSGMKLFLLCVHRFFGPVSVELDVAFRCEGGAAIDQAAAEAGGR